MALFAGPWVFSGLKSMD